MFDKWKTLESTEGQASERPLSKTIDFLLSVCLGCVCGGGWGVDTTINDRDQKVNPRDTQLTSLDSSNAQTH